MDPNRSEQVKLALEEIDRHPGRYSSKDAQDGMLGRLIQEHGMRTRVGGGNQTTKLSVTRYREILRNVTSNQFAGDSNHGQKIMQLFERGSRVVQKEYLRRIGHTAQSRPRQEASSGFGQSISTNQQPEGRTEMQPNTTVSAGRLQQAAPISSGAIQTQATDTTPAAGGLDQAAPFSSGPAPGQKRKPDSSSEIRTDNGKKPKLSDSLGTDIEADKFDGPVSTIGKVNTLTEMSIGGQQPPKQPRSGKVVAGAIEVDESGAGKRKADEPIQRLGDIPKKPKMTEAPLTSASEETSVAPKEQQASMIANPLGISQGGSELKRKREVPGSQDQPNKQDEQSEPSKSQRMTLQSSPRSAQKQKNDTNESGTAKTNYEATRAGLENPEAAVGQEKTSEPYIIEHKKYKTAPRPLTLEYHGPEVEARHVFGIDNDVIQQKLQNMANSVFGWGMHLTKGLGIDIQKRAEWVMNPKPELLTLYKWVFGKEWETMAFFMNQAEGFTSLQTIQSCLYAAVYKVLFEDPLPWPTPEELNEPLQQLQPFLNGMLRERATDPTILAQLYKATFQQFLNTDFIQWEICPVADKLAAEFMHTIQPQLGALGAKDVHAGNDRKEFWQTMYDKVGYIFREMLTLKGLMRTSKWYYDHKWFESGTAADPMTMESIAPAQDSVYVKFCQHPAIFIKAKKEDEFQLIVPAKVWYTDPKPRDA